MAKETDVHGRPDRTAAEQVIGDAFARAGSRSADGHSEVQSFRSRTSRPRAGDARG